MSKISDGKAEKKLSEIIRIPWVRKSAVLGLMVLVVGLAIVLTVKTLDFDLKSALTDIRVFLENYGIMGIFIASVLAGTVVPLGSPVLVTIAASFGLPPITLAVVAAIGFTIGMSVNYGLAYKFGRPYVLRKLGKDRLMDISNLWARWGWIIYVIFGVIPVLPVELLSLFCGLLKVRFDIFLLLTFTTRLILFTALVYFGEYIGLWLGIL